MSNEILDSLFGGEDDIETETPVLAGAETQKTSNEPITEIRSISSVGGGRGLFAKQYIPAGTLVLAEVPVQTWNGRNLDDRNDLCDVLEAVISDEKAHRITQNLYPVVIDQADVEEIKRVEESLIEERATRILAALAVRHQFVESRKIDRTEMARVLLALQHNGFASGLYGVLTMINHSCNPNAIKFSPSTGSSGASEIWTVLDIDEGEEITICYCEPLEMSRQSMHEFLITHHRFTCQCSLCTGSGSGSDGSIASASVPVSVREQTEHEGNTASEGEKAADQEQDVNTRITKEEQEGRLQEMIQAMETELNFWKQIDDAEFDGSFEGMTKLMKAVNDIALQMIQHADDTDTPDNDDGTGLLQQQQFALSPRILARVFKLSANASALFLDKVQNLPDGHKKPKSALIASAALSFFRSSVRLLRYQLKYLGPSHPDIGSTNNDIAQGLSCLLDSFPQELVDTLSSSSSSSNGDDDEIRFCLDGPVPTMVATISISALGNSQQQQQSGGSTASIPPSTLKAIRLLTKRAISRFQTESSRIQSLYARGKYKALSSYRSALILSSVGTSGISGARAGMGISSNNNAASVVDVSVAGRGYPGACYWGDFIPHHIK